MIKNVKSKLNEPMFITWEDPAKDGGKSLNIAIASSAKQQQIIQRVTASTRDNISIRDESTRADYEAFRPSERIPREAKNIIYSCRNAYRKVPLVRNIIDLMGDFTVQGMEIVHPQAKYDKLCKDWAKQIRLKHTSERFMNMLYREANVIVSRETAKLTKKQVEKIHLLRTKADTDIDVEAPPSPKKYEIPWKYIVRSSLNVDILGGELALFAGQIEYGQKLPLSLIKKVKNPSNEAERKLVAKLHPEILNSINKGMHVRPLDPEKTRGFYYKKDDEQLWAEPMTYPLLPDLQMLDKLRLADMAALDGAISHVRLWRLGSLEHRILPTDAAVARLAEILVNNVGGGAIDLIWGPELDLKETSTDIFRFLGREKYLAALESIYAGLGVPPTLTGAASAAGFTNNFISLKTLTERLNYGRMILCELWEHEFALFAEGMNLSMPPQLRFSHMTLSDEAAELALLIQLLDRGIISDDTILERFGESPSLEEWRVKREQKKREKERKPAKVGPYHTDHKTEMKKNLLNQGTVAPSQVGLNLPEPKPGEKTPGEVKVEHRNKAVTNPNRQGKSGEGRPPNSKDSKKRKQKRVLPRGVKASVEFATTMAWAREAQRGISDILNPIWLETCGKKNMRQLSEEEAKNIEELKYAALCSLEPHSDVDQTSIVGLLEKSIFIPVPIQKLVQATVLEYINKHSKEPSIEEYRGIQVSVYTLYKGNWASD